MKFIKLALVFTFALQSSRAYQFYALSTVLNFDRMYVEDIHIDIYPDGIWGNIFYILARDQPSDIWLVIIVDIKSRRSQNYRTLFRSKPNNLCALTNDPSTFSYTLLDIMERGGVNLRKCPLKKANFTWTNVSARSLNIPALNAGVYRTVLLNSFEKGVKLISNLTVFFEVK